MPVAAALLAFLLAFAGAHAAAMYVEPEVVEIPTKRIVTNLNRALVFADGAKRLRLEIALGRVHAGAWAEQTQTFAVLDPQTIHVRPPQLLSGPSDPRKRGLLRDQLRGALEMFIGGSTGRQTSGPVRWTRSQRFRHGRCFGPKRHAYTGVIVLDITLPHTTDATPVAVRVVSQDVGDEAMTSCLAQHLGGYDGLPAATRETRARVRIVLWALPLEPHYQAGWPHLPRTVSRDPADDVARGHLVAAVEHYRRAIELDPALALPRLGLGWVLEQSDQLDRAVDAYRSAFALAWPIERDLRRHFDHDPLPIADEAAHALLRLLPRDDASAPERRVLEAAITRLERPTRFVTPIVVPLGTSATLGSCVDPEAGVAFDLDGSGVVRRWGWIRPGAAWLVYDRDGTGEIASGLQLFGSVTFWSFWSDGYEALAALDDDGDGFIRDDERRGLALWEDVDGDGVSDPGEVRALSAHGVTALSTRAAPDASGVLTGTVTFADGRVRPTWDWVSPEAEGPPSTLE